MIERRDDLVTDLLDAESDDLVPSIPALPLLTIIPSADRHPALVYLSQFGSPDEHPERHARRTMRGALNVLAGVLQAPPHHDQRGRDARYLLIPWYLLRAQHTKAIRGQLQAPLAGRSAPPSPASANLYLQALRGVLTTCFDLELLTADELAHAVRALKPVKGKRELAGRELTPGEISALLQACAADPSPIGRRDQAMIAVLRATGLRRHELVGLDLADYDAASLALRVLGKGNNERIVYLSPSVVPTLKAWLAVRGTFAGDPRAPLFPAIRKGGHVTDRRLDGEAVCAMLAVRAGEAGIAEPFSPHDFRRTFISDLFDQGVDPATVQALAGHADIKTTAKYDRRGERAKQRAVATIHVPHFAPAASTETRPRNGRRS